MNTVEVLRDSESKREERKLTKRALRILADKLANGERPSFLLVQIGTEAGRFHCNELNARQLYEMARNMTKLALQGLDTGTHCPSGIPNCDSCAIDFQEMVIRATTALDILNAAVRAPHSGRELGKDEDDGKKFS